MVNETQERTRPLPINTTVTQRIPYGVQSGSAPAPHTIITLDLTPETAKALDQLLQQTVDSPDDLFRKAIALYKVTKEAIQAGKFVGIAETDDGLESRFVGL